MTICTKKEPKWLDICTLVVPRKAVSDMVRSFFLNVDRSGFLLRWIVNYDPVPSLMHNNDACLALVRRLSGYFDDFIFVPHNENVGYRKSFVSVMSRVKSDFCLYVEDDKIFNGRFSLSDFVTEGVDYVSLSGNRIQPGNTGAGVWSKKFVDLAIKNPKILETENNLEVLNKRLFLGNRLKRGKTADFSGDNGLKSLYAENLMRVARDDGNPGYIQIPDLFFVVFKDDGIDCAKLASKREWSLCSGAFEERHVEKDEPIDLEAVKNKWILLMSSNLVFMAKAKKILTLVGGKNDVILFERIPRCFVVLRTETAKALVREPTRATVNEIFDGIEKARSDSTLSPLIIGTGFGMMRKSLLGDAEK